MKHTSLLARAAAATGAVSTVLAGAMIVTTAPAQAALKETNFGFRTYAYGTNVRAPQVGLGSSPTAQSFLGCTRLAGKKDDEKLAAVNAPTNTPLLGIGAVTSHSETFKRANGDVGTLSTNKVANVKLGGSTGPYLIISGLQTTAEAWADKKGKLHTQGTFKLADIQAKTGIAQVDEVLNQVNVTISDLFKTILKLPNDELVIPSVGRITLGGTSSKVNSSSATQLATALKVELFGPNTKPGGGDDISVTIGRSSARVLRNVPNAVMGGAAWAANVEVLDGLVGVGRVARQPLNCRGTNGKIVSNNVAGLNPANLNVLDVAAASGRAYGVQRKDGSATAWTEGRIASVSLGSGDTKLVIKGVVGRATMNKSKTGKITKSKAGTKLASITFGGKEYDVPSLGDKIEIPGLATLKFGVVENKTSRRMKVIAVQLVLVPAASQKTGLATVNLGVAEVVLRRL